MSSFRIAEAYVEVDADQSAYDRAMAKLRSQKPTIKIGVDLDDKAAVARLRELAGTRRMTVKVDLDQTALAALNTGNRSVKIKADLDASTYLTQLERITRDQVVRITAQLNANQYLTQLSRITRDQVVNVNPNLRASAYLTQLERITRDQRLNITANLDAARARAEIAELSRNRSVRIDVDRSGLDGLTGAVRNLGSASGGSSGGLMSLVSWSRLLWTSVITGSPAIASLSQAIMQMGPAAAVAVPALASLGSVFGALKVGLGGIGDAFKAQFAPAVTSGQAAAQSARAVENAERSLAKAQQAVKDAEVNAAAARVKAARDIADAQQNLKNTVSDVADSNRKAAESVASAERDLADAQKAAKQAQEDLTQARKDAAEQLVDLNNQLTDSELDHREAVLRVQDAQAQLNKVMSDPNATQQQRDEAQLTYDQAVQHLKEQEIAEQRLKDKVDAANKAGVEGSDAVKKAKQGIADANQTVIDKTRELKDAEIEAARAQVDGAQRVAKAQRDVVDAQAAAAKAATDGARQIADAEDNAKQAAEALADAQNSGAAATNKVAQAMAQLSPNARAFVNTVLALKPAWDALRLQVQDTLFAGLSSKLRTTATTVLPDLRAGLTGTAGVLNTVAKNALDAVGNLSKTGGLRRIFSGVNESLKPLSKIPAQIITAFGQLAQAAMPVWQQFTKSVGEGVTSLSGKLTAAFKSGKLTDAINTAATVFKQFLKLGIDIGVTIGNVFKAAAAGGGNALGALGQVFAELRRITAMPEVQKALTSIFQALNAVGRVFATTIGAVLQAALPILGAIAPVVTTLANALGPVLKQLAQSLGQAVMPIVRALLPVVLLVGRALIQVVSALTPLLKPIGDLIASVIRALAPALTPIVNVIVGIVQQLAGPLAQIIKSLTPAINTFGQLFAQVFQALEPLFPPLLDIIGQLGKLIATVFTAEITGLMNAMKPLIPVVVQIVALLVRFLTAALKPLAPIIQQVAGIMAQLFTKVMAALAPVIEQVATTIMRLLPAFEPLIPAFADLAQQVLGLLPQLLQLATTVLPPLLGLVGKLAGLLLGALGKALQVVIPMVVQITSLFIEMQAGLVRVVGGALGWIVDKFQELYDILVGHSIVPDLVNAIVSWFTTLWTNAVQIFGEIKQWIVDTWNQIWDNVSRAWSTFWTTLSGLWNTSLAWIKQQWTNVKNSVTQTWSNMWTSIRTTFSNVWATVKQWFSDRLAWVRQQFTNVKNSVTTTWSNMWGGIRDKATSIFNTIKGKVTDFKNNVATAFQHLRDTIGTLWGKVTDKVKTPVAWVIQHVYTGGIKRMWDSIADKVGLPHLPEVSAKFAKGGVVPGHGTGDTVPAMLTPGERVLSLSQVARLGGHRGIDALLGEDTKSRQGGNPKPSKDHQSPGYASGGIIGSIKDVGSSVVHGIASGVDWVKDLVVGGLKAAAQKAIAGLIRPLINSIPGGGTALGSLLKAIPNKALDGILSWFGKEDAKATGGPAVQRALGWARTQAGLPYQWAGNGNPSWDCSGLMSAIESVIRGEAPHRRWATGAFSGDTAPAGWVHNLQSPFMIGITNAGVGHTAGTIAGVNVESRGGAGVIVGSGARGYNDSLFTDRYGFAPAAKYDQGGLLQPGATLAVNRTGRPEAVLTAEERAKFEAIVNGLGDGVGGVHVTATVNWSSLTVPSQAQAQQVARELREAMAEELRKLNRSKAR